MDYASESLISRTNNYMWFVINNVTVEFIDLVREKGVDIIRNGGMIFGGLYVILRALDITEGILRFKFGSILLNCDSDIRGKLMVVFDMSRYGYIYDNTFNIVNIKLLISGRDRDSIECFGESQSQVNEEEFIRRLNYIRITPEFIELELKKVFDKIDQIEEKTVNDKEETYDKYYIHFPKFTISKFQLNIEKNNIYLTNQDGEFDIFSFSGKIVYNSNKIRNNCLSLIMNSGNSYDMYDSYGVNVFYGYAYIKCFVLYLK